MKPLNFLHYLIAGSVWLAALTPTVPAQSHSQASEPIPASEWGAKAGAQYQGDGLSLVPNLEGARLRCVFQKLEGEVTREGLWLTSTVSNAASNRFRVTAVAVGRAEAFGLRRQSAAATPLFEGEQMGEATLSSETESGVALRFPPHSKTCSIAVAPVAALRGPPALFQCTFL